MLNLVDSSEVLEGTTILPSAEELKEQEFFEDHLGVERELYADDVLSEFFDNSLDEKIKMDWRIEQRHKRKEECCTKWSKQSDGLGKHYTKKTNPCGCPECEKCIPSKINNYRKEVYSKYGPIIYVNSATRFDIKTERDIDCAYNLRTHWRYICAAEGKTNVSVQIVNNGIILVSNDIEQVKIDEPGKTNDDIEIISVENDCSNISVKKFDEFAKRCVYFNVQQDVADYWFRKYNGDKKILHIGHEIYEKPKLKIACAEVNVKNAKGLVETRYYAQTYHSEPVSNDEAKYLSTPVYVEIDAPNVYYGLHDSGYVNLENFVKKVEFNSDNSYVTDWLIHFGRGDKSIKLLLKLKEQYEKKKDDGG